MKRYGSVSENEPLGRHTTFRAGGPADLFLVPRAVDVVPDILRDARQAGVPVTVIGGGSNLLVGDRGVRGLVLAVTGGGEGSTSMMEDGIIRADASVTKEDFICFAADRGCRGVEFMAGIPGAIGGGIAMNAGTYMGCFGDYLHRVEFVSPAGEWHTMDMSPGVSAYRNFSLPRGSVITRGFFSFRDREDPDVIHRRVRDIVDDRRCKHPMEFPSAGSVFKNPEGHSSWKLIRDAGLSGSSVGGAMVSEKHTNFIINTGSATAGDIRSLIELVRERVESRFSLRLETEIRMVGEF